MSTRAKVHVGTLGEVGKRFVSACAGSNMVRRFAKVM